MSRNLVAYFSATGSTEKAARKLAESLHADLFRIVPEKAYSRADLDWMDKKSRSSIEMNDPGCRPAIMKEELDPASYDTIFLGFPIWWYVAPRIIQTFLETYDFSGKKIVLFATSGGSGFGKAADELKQDVPALAVIEEGAILNSEQAVKALAKRFS